MILQMLVKVNWKFGQNTKNNFADITKKPLDK